MFYRNWMAFLCGWKAQRTVLKALLGGKYVFALLAKQHWTLRRKAANKGAVMHIANFTKLAIKYLVCFACTRQRVRLITLQDFVFFKWVSPVQLLSAVSRMDRQNKSNKFGKRSIWPVSLKLNVVMGKKNLPVSSVREKATDKRRDSFILADDITTLHTLTEILSLRCKINSLLKSLTSS